MTIGGPIYLVLVAAVLTAVAAIRHLHLRRLRQTGYWIRSENDLLGILILLLIAAAVTLPILW